jgi:hypothetical protein
MIHLAALETQQHTTSPTINRKTNNNDIVSIKTQQTNRNRTKTIPLHQHHRHQHRLSPKPLAPVHATRATTQYTFPTSILLLLLLVIIGCG